MMRTAVGSLMQGVAMRVKATIALLAFLLAVEAKAEKMEYIRSSCLSTKFDSCMIYGGLSPSNSVRRMNPSPYITMQTSELKIAHCNNWAISSCTGEIDVATAAEVKTLLEESERRQREQLEAWLKVLEDTGVVVRREPRSQP